MTEPKVIEVDFEEVKDEAEIVKTKINKRDKKKIVFLALLVLVIGFTIYSLLHPEASFPLSNRVVYTIYDAVIIVTICLGVSIYRTKKR